MKIYRLKYQQTIPASIEKVWEFFLDPRNLKLITPEYMGFDIVSEMPNQMYAGMLIRYKVRPLFNLSLDWITEITHLDPLKIFVDEQRFGPYKFWHHQHIFKEEKDKVLMTDLVHYAIGYSLAGSLAHRVLINKKLEEIFNYRFNTVEKIFGK
jgi:ligand-binding SRPBCC domain-containing protein